MPGRAPRPRGLALPLVVLFLVAPAGAAAAVPRRTSAGVGPARVLVHSRPFRLALAPRGGGPARLVSAAGHRRAGGVPYAALGYSVGPDPDLRYPELAGQALNPPRTGPVRRHRATRVVAVRRGGRRLTLVLATDDPAGRRLRVDLAPAGDMVSLAVRVARPRGVSALALAFACRPGEAFHGLGGRRESTDLRGQDVTSWVLDYRFPDAATGYYAPQNVVYSSRGYGLFLAGGRIARWRLCSDTSRAWRVSRAGRALRLDVALGRPRQTIAAVTRRTGRTRVAPRWSMGPTLSRTIGLAGDAAAGGYRARVQDDVRRLLHGHLPVTAYAFEGWAGLPRAFVRRVIRRLAGHGIATELYLRSFVADDIAGTEPPGLFARAIAKGYVATTAGGRPYLFPSPFPGAQAAVIDFTDPAARRWWRRRVFALLDTGARGFMNDFGEQVLPGMHFHDGRTGVTLHNRYPVLQARVTRSAVAAWSRRHPHRRRPFFFQRAGFSGAPGSARYDGAEFPGDETTDWQAATGLPSIVPDMLNRAVGGAPGFTTDIGGYAQFTPTDPRLPPPGRELFLRWTEAAALTPFFRVHNSGFDGAQMPWSYDRATLRAWVSFARLHRRAEPLIRGLWRRFTRTGVPMTRPLWLADPGHPPGARGDDEWLLGPDLLVAPVLHQGARTRPVRLPRGCWRLHGTGPRRAGDRDVAVRAPLTTLPWFTRCGAAPLGGP